MLPYLPPPLLDYKNEREGDKYESIRRGYARLSWQAFYPIILSVPSNFWEFLSCCHHFHPLSSHTRPFIRYFDYSMKEGRIEMSLCAEDMPDPPSGPSNQEEKNKGKEDDLRSTMLNCFHKFQIVTLLWLKYCPTSCPSIGAIRRRKDKRANLAGKDNTTGRCLLELVSTILFAAIYKCSHHNLHNILLFVCLMQPVGRRRARRQGQMVRRTQPGGGWTP